MVLGASPIGTCWAGDHGLLVTLGTEASREVHQRVVAATRALEAAALPGLRDLHPAYASILITFERLEVEPEILERRVRDAVALARIDDSVEPRLVEIPVCYEGEHAPDLAEVSRRTGLSPEEVVRLHSSGDYFVHFLGFVAGFPYLGGMPRSLATPRLAAPRRRVPAGSVAIAGAQTGIYPFSTPGGWRIVGRTPTRLFVPDREPPNLLAPGDRVRFVAIAAERYLALGPR